MNNLTKVKEIVRDHTVDSRTVDDRSSETLRDAHIDLDSAFAIEEHEGKRTETYTYTYCRVVIGHQTYSLQHSLEELRTMAERTRLLNKKAKKD